MNAPLSSSRLCRSRWLMAAAPGLGVGWAMSVAVNPGVGIAVGGALAAILLTQRR